MSDKPFRVLLDVTELNIEFVNYVWINVSPRELKTIADFKANVLKKLHIDRNIRLFLRDGLLLEEETVIILREDDTIKVKYEGEYSSAHNFSSTSIDDGNPNMLKKRSLNESNENESVSKKRSKITNILNNNESNEVERSFEVKIDKKRKKSCRSHSLPFMDNIIPCPTDNEIADMDLTCVKAPRNKVSPIILNEENILDKNVSFPGILDKTGESEVGSINSVKSASEILQGNNCRKKKRKRHKKRKDNFMLETSSDNYESNLSFTVEPIITNVGSASVRKHVVFTSPNPYNDANNEESTEINIVESDIASYQKNTTKQCSKIVHDNSERLTGSTSNIVFHDMCHLESPVVQENGSSNAMKCNGVSVSKCYKQNGNSKALKYADFPILNSMPEIGSKIVYKILELNEHYSPEVSEYKEGIIKNIDPETDEIEIELLKHEIKPGRTGKFENLREDEVPLPEVIKIDKVSWSTLIDPRLILS